MKYLTKINWPLSLVALLIAFTFSCKDNEEPTTNNNNNNTGNNNNNQYSEINQWIFGIMDFWYYWTEDMNAPLSATEDPEDFFEALLVDQDRFSAIYPDYQELINSLEGVSKEAGYEFGLFRESSTNNRVIAEVFYIKKGSPADGKNIRRGDIITHVNGNAITLANYQTLLKEMEEPHTLTTHRYDDEERRYLQLPEDISLTTTILSEDPVFLDSMYTIEGHKIGYLVYNFFTPGEDVGSANENAYGVYDQELDEKFAEFKAEGIQDLIIDLRYNGGGFVSSAINLASLIGLGVTENDIFYQTRYNTTIQSEYIRQFGEDELTKEFVTKAENLGAQLNGGRVYFLTSNRTASASELVINGLKPYMDVKIVGDTTFGKNVGSIALEDENNEDNPYGLLPIVSQSFNSLDQSDYSNGFVPDILAREFEERLKPFGDSQELLLRKAIAEITGIPDNTRVEKLDRKDVATSIEQKPRFGKMVDNLHKLQIE